VVVEIRRPQHPEYATQQEVEACRDYRLVLWEHQLPPEGSGVAPEHMAWTELTVDVLDAQDVQEVIEWAEANIHEALTVRNTDRPHGERVYVLYVKVPREDRYLQILGWDPTRSTDAPPGWNLGRRRPS